MNKSKFVYKEIFKHNSYRVIISITLILSVLSILYLHPAPVPYKDWYLIQKHIYNFLHSMATFMAEYEAFFAILSYSLPLLVSGGLLLIGRQKKYIVVQLKTFIINRKFSIVLLPLLLLRSFFIMMYASVANKIISAFFCIIIMCIISIYVMCYLIRVNNDNSYEIKEISECIIRLSNILSKNAKGYERYLSLVFPKVGYMDDEKPDQKMAYDINILESLILLGGDIFVGHDEKKRIMYICEIIIPILAHLRRTYDRQTPHLISELSNHISCNNMSSFQYNFYIQGTLLIFMHICIVLMDMPNPKDETLKDAVDNFIKYRNIYYRIFLEVKDSGNNEGVFRNIENISKYIENVFEHDVTRNLKKIYAQCLEWMGKLSVVNISSYRVIENNYMKYRMIFRLNNIEEKNTIDAKYNIWDFLTLPLNKR